ncbi:tol-pal system protein YbgF [Desulfovibrio aerotolerans]|uniref:Tol-pal system protein YbgF n=1 Tax=Solidesulfovibrio aerotolerans TaxID=295255 RepID=A0A7C9MN55_9BACT|nr:tol-pal system protein YbgF [Solidesulfovibrio aerotolerans]MYL82412.1 tol-pal system protein YbgF [Solidesulfovibrio aerotolerans]
MSYYQALGMTREPFSNSPDPDMLYRSRTHLECLQHMEIAVRLRRGLNVVLGEVGTGKTTLSRELARLLAQDGDLEAHLLDDPYCPSATEFLLSLARLFGLDTAAIGRDAALLKDALKASLLTRSQDGQRIVTLLIDEGQKITPECLELLRELLNFETNTHKLLQIVIFAQTEFEEILLERPNLDDRVNYRYRLQPLDRLQTRRMIETRLALCTPDGKVPAVFTRLALRRIHKLTGGYPRKIVRLCHLSMLLAVGFGKRRIGWGLVGRASRRESCGPGRVWLRRLAVAGAAGGLVALTLHFGPALPDARQAALDALGRLQTQLTALAFDPAAKAVAREPVAPGTPEKAAIAAAPQAEKAKPAQALPGQSAFEEALGLEAAGPAKSPAAKVGEPAAAKAEAAAAKVETAGAKVETAAVNSAPPAQQKVAPAPAPVESPPAAKADEAPSAAKPASPVPGNAETATPTQKAEYNKALQLAINGRTAEAKAAFDQFLTANPNSPLTPNALYWVGEGAFARGEYQTAIADFEKVAKGWPGHHKAADSLYKMAMAQEKAGDTPAARASLERYLTDYPNAELAGMARQKLQALPK